MTKTTCHILALAVGIVALAISSFTAKATLVDITANDGLQHNTYGSDPRAGIAESGSVTTPAINNSDWDLRAFAFDINANKLTVVSGFNPLQKLNNFGLGDIFIDTNNSFTIPSPLSSNLNSAFGFELAIDLKDPWAPATPGQISYRVLSLTPDTQLQLPAYGNSYPELAKGAPVLVSNLGSGSVVTPGFLTTNVITMTDSQVLNLLGLNIGTNGGTNYVFTFDLSSVSLYNGATFRLTEECGNDLMVGHLAAGVAAVPETSTWVMGFLALGAVVFMVRRSAKLAA